jgi:hypothetical protein
VRPWSSPSAARSRRRPGIPLTEDGENNAGSFGAAQGSDSRRCRLTLSGHNPLRRAFTRLNSTATTAASMDIALPRGSTSIHLYVVLGGSAGQVESAWPSGPTPDDSLIAIAAAHIAKPALDQSVRRTRPA